MSPWVPDQVRALDDTHQRPAWMDVVPEGRTHPAWRLAVAGVLVTAFGDTAEVREAVRAICHPGRPVRSRSRPARHDASS